MFSCRCLSMHRTQSGFWRIVRGVGDIHGLNVRRVDQRSEPTPIVSDILEEIERAEIIIVDPTDLNANVMYEVGIAHVRCSSVILLCQEGQPLPFNLAAIRCIFYSLSSTKGQVEFAGRLGKTLAALRSVGPPTIITSTVDRTNTVIADLQSLGELPDEDLRQERVWFSDSLSAFAIDEEEPFRPEETGYRETLLKEKQSLLGLAHRGCSIRCIITPPTSRLAVHRLEVLQHRLSCLLQFLESGDSEVDHIDFVVSPFRQKNLYIIGHISCIEGYKKGIQRGYSLNLRQTQAEAIRSSTSLYEALFSHSRNTRCVSMEAGGRKGPEI